MAARRVALNAKNHGAVTGTGGLTTSGGKVFALL